MSRGPIITSTVYNGRTVWNIDVGKMSKSERNKYVKDMIKKYKRKIPLPISQVRFE